MKSTRFLPLALVVCAMGAPAWAAQEDPHKGHHSAGSNPAPASKATAEKPSADAARMATQTTAMREMHDKLMAAKTPEERNALMGEHMKTMQDGMAMMNGMSAGGMAAMKGGMKGDMAGQHRDMSAQHQSMEKRMEMMQAALQMMMDRLPAAPAR